MVAVIFLAQQLMFNPFVLLTMRCLKGLLVNGVMSRAFGVKWVLTGCMVLMATTRAWRCGMQQEFLVES